jgi:hypothetical protein
MMKQKCWVTREFHEGFWWWMVGCQRCGRIVCSSYRWEWALDDAFSHAKGHEA